MLIAAVIIFALYFLIKGSNLRVAGSFVVLVFTSLFYKEKIFTVFASLVWVLLLFAAYYLKRDVGSIFKGFIIGAVSSVACYYGALFL